jgi:hypothetical protein
MNRTKDVVVLVQSKVCGKGGPQRAAVDLDGFGSCRAPLWLSPQHPPADRGGKNSNQMTNLKSWRWSLQQTPYLFRPFVSSRVHRDIWFANSFGSYSRLLAAVTRL